MLKKPNDYDTVELKEFDFVPINLGGHKGIIKNVEEYTSVFSNKTSLKVYVDTDKNDAQPDYFSTQYKNDTKEDKKWNNAAIKYVSLGDEETQVRMLKAFITCVENSNPGFKFDWDKDLTQLKNKKIGLVYGLEEYINKDGLLKTNAKLRDFRSVDKVDNVKIPKVKLADQKTYVEYEEYIKTKNTTSKNISEAIDNFSSITEVDTSDLPF